LDWKVIEDKREAAEQKYHDEHVDAMQIDDEQAKLED